MTQMPEPLMSAALEACRARAEQAEARLAAAESLLRVPASEMDTAYFAACDAFLAAGGVSDA